MVNLTIIFFAPSGDQVEEYGVTLVVTSEIGNRINDFKPITNQVAHMMFKTG